MAKSKAKTQHRMKRVAVLAAKRKGMAPKRRKALIAAAEKLHAPDKMFF